MYWEKQKKIKGIFLHSVLDNFLEYYVPVTAFHYVTPAYAIYDMLHYTTIMQSDLSSVTQSEALTNV